METIRFVVERITYQNPENGYAVLKVNMKDYRDLVTVVGTFGDLFVGTVLLCEGYWHEDRKYGRAEALATMDEHNLYLKLLNNSDREETVNISSEIPLEEGYAWSVVRGEPGAMNSLDHPETVRAEHGTAPAGTKTYTAPKWSFSVLTFRRK